jgi:hypothetical protein
VNNISFPKLIVGAATALSLPLAMLLGAWIGEGRTRELLMLIGLAAGGFLLLGIPHWLWMFAVGSIFVPGQLPFLPLPLQPMEIFLLMAIARFAVDDMILRKKWLKAGPQPDGMFLLLLLAILLMHGFQDRFAVRLLGSDIWGGRSYFTILIAFAAYFVLQSTRINASIFRNIPTVILLFGLVEFFFNAVTFAVPDLAGPLRGIYSSVSADSGEIFARRLGFAANFGYLLLFWSLADCRIQDFLNKGRIIKAAAFGLGIVLCLLSGYRSSIFIAIIITGVAAFRDFGFAAIFLLIPMSLGLSTLVGLHLAGVQLPVTIQRGLVWIPGAGWDEAATADAGGSNEFRFEVWDLWWRTEFGKHPVLGRGFGIHYDEMIATLPFTSEDLGGYTSTAAMLSKYTRDEAFVVSGNLHHGLFSTIDRFGLIGAFLFVAWTVVALRRMFSELITSRNGPMNPALQWIGLYVISFSIAFPMGALKIENFLPQQLFLCGLFAALAAASRGNSPPKQLQSPYRRPAAPDLAAPMGRPLSISRKPTA